MKFTNPYWSNKIKISTLQRWIIVHSIIYYELNSSLVDDFVFDQNARQLVAMQKAYKDEAKESQYWYMFYDFDASTGFHLYDRLDKHDKEYLSKIARHVLWVAKGGESNGKRNSKHDSRK